LRVHKVLFYNQKDLDRYLRNREIRADPIWYDKGTPMIQPQPHKLKCPKCNYSKVVSPKSDVLDPRDFLGNCPKCDALLEKMTLNKIEKFISKVFG